MENIGINNQVTEQKLMILTHAQMTIVSQKQLYEVNTMLNIIH